MRGLVRFTKLLSIYSVLKRLIKSTQKTKRREKMAYKIIYKDGISFTSNAITLVEAKKEASEYAGYGFGCICIVDENDDSDDPIAIKMEHDMEWIEPEL